MKLFRSILIIILFVFDATSQEIREANSISPSDIGIVKYIFELQVPEAQVAVFRREKYSEGKLIDRFDTISNQRDQKHSDSVLLIDRLLLTGQDGLIVKTSGSSFSLTAASLKSTGYSSNPSTVYFVFQEYKDKQPTETKLIFTMFLESYDSAKRRHPKLSDDKPNESWTSAYSEDIHK